MTTQNNSSENNNVISATPAEKVVIGTIPDNTGHTDFTGTIAEAIAAITKVMQASINKSGLLDKKMTYLNGTPFFFEGEITNEVTEKMAEVLNKEEEPTFMVTPQLQGGATKAITRKFACRIAKTPLTRFLSDKTRAHIIISLSNDKKVRKATAYISAYNGALERARDLQTEIISAVVAGLLPVSVHTKAAAAQVRSEKKAAKSAAKCSTVKAICKKPAVKTCKVGNSCCK